MPIYKCDFCESPLRSRYSYRGYSYCTPTCLEKKIRITQAENNSHYLEDKRRNGTSRREYVSHEQIQCMIKEALEKVKFLKETEVERTNVSLSIFR